MPNGGVVRRGGDCTCGPATAAARTGADWVASRRGRHLLDRAEVDVVRRGLLGLDLGEERVEVEILALVEHVRAGELLDLAGQRRRLLDQRDRVGELVFGQLERCVAVAGRQVAVRDHGVELEQLLGRRLPGAGATVHHRDGHLAIAHDLLAHALGHRREDLLGDRRAGLGRLAADLRQVAVYVPFSIWRSVRRQYALYEPNFCCSVANR